jgi:hypothetical protein
MFLPIAATFSSTIRSADFYLLPGFEIPEVSSFPRAYAEVGEFFTGVPRNAATMRALTEIFMKTIPSPGKSAAPGR